MEGRASRFLAAVTPSTAADMASSHYKRCTRSPAPLPKVSQSLLDQIIIESDGDSSVAFIKTYTMNELFADVNLALREDDPVALETHGGYIYGLKDAMKHKGKACGWYRGHAFRGMVLPDDVLDWYRSLSCDDKFLWAGFISASKEGNAAFNGNIIFEIDCNGSGCTYALDIEQWSVFPEEKEILFYPYSGFCFKGSREEHGVLLVSLQSHDRELIDESDWKEKVAKKEALRSASKSFVLQVGMELVCGNKKHAHAWSTALRHRPDDAKGTNFNGVCVLNGASVVVRELQDQNAWALVEGEAGSGWIKTRNLHVQLGGVTSASKVGDGFFVLGPGRRAVAGNTRHASIVTALRHRPCEKKGANFNGVQVRDGEQINIISETTDDGEWVKVSRADGGEGWLKTRNVHVQLV